MARYARRLLPALVALLATACASGGMDRETFGSMAPRFPLSSVIRTGDIFWMSGKLGANAETRAMTTGRTAAEVRNIMESFREQLAEHGLGFEDVVSVTVYLTDLEGGYQELNQVYSEYFPTNPPTRAALGISDLVGDAVVEISMTAVRAR